MCIYVWNITLKYWIKKQTAIVLLYRFVESFSLLKNQPSNPEFDILTCMLFEPVLHDQNRKQIIQASIFQQMGPGFTIS